MVDYSTKNGIYRYHVFIWYTEAQLKCKKILAATTNY